MPPKPLQVLVKKVVVGTSQKVTHFIIGYNVWGIVHANAKCERQQVK